MRKSSLVKNVFSIYLLILCSTQLVADEDKKSSSDNELNELIQGFDEPSNEANKSDLDELLQGFESQEPEQSENLDQLISGFDEPQSPIVEQTNTVEARWDLTTLISLSTSYNYQRQAAPKNHPDYHGLSRLKLKIQPEFRYKFSKKWDSLISGSLFYDSIYRLKDRSNYSDEVLDNHESEAEFREVYLRGTLSDNFDIRLGRQIVVWGKSDSIRVVDVLNPLDFREPGMIDIEDLRLPVTMIKADYYFNDWNLSTILIPEIRFNKMPAHESDFSIFESPPPSEETPDDISNLELAVALNGVFSGWDLSFYAAHYYDDQAHIVTINETPTSLVHSRLSMIGAATNIALGNWLIKIESAYISGLAFSDNDKSYSRSDLMMGVDYAGITDMTFSIEVLNRHLNNYDRKLAENPDSTEENEGQIALRYTANFMREKLNLVTLASILGTNLDNGAFYRASLEYEIRDAMTIMFGGIVYQSGDNKLIKKIASNDRLFLDVRYSF